MTNPKERYELKITYGLDEKEEVDLLTKLGKYNLEKSIGKRTIIRLNGWNSFQSIVV